MRATVSSKYRIVIPREIRESLKLKPGAKVEFVRSGGAIRLVRVGPLRELKGLLNGAPAFEREPDRRMEQ